MTGWAGDDFIYTENSGAAENPGKSDVDDQKKKKKRSPTRTIFSDLNLEAVILTSKFFAIFWVRYSPWGESCEAGRFRICEMLCTQGWNDLDRVIMCTQRMCVHNECLLREISM